MGTWIFYILMPHTGGRIWPVLSHLFNFSVVSTCEMLKDRGPVPARLGIGAGPPVLPDAALQGDIVAAASTLAIHGLFHGAHPLDPTVVNLLKLLVWLRP